MMREKLQVHSSPHLFSEISKIKIMWFVVLALLPTTAYGIYIYGFRALIIIVIAVVSAIVTESFFNHITKKPNEISSAVVTGLLLALIIPPSVPLWMPALGSFIALTLAKHIFGGSGNSMFNPALVGRAVLQVSFPGEFTKYFKPFDSVTIASPLEVARTEGLGVLSSQYQGSGGIFKSLFFGNVAGSIGETSALLILIGGFFLLYMRIIEWRVPTFVLLGSVILSFIVGDNPLFHLLSGGLLLGAFFLATSYEGLPCTKMGLVYYGLGIGVLTIILRKYSGYYEGINYAILLMNAASPIIERLTIEKPFGHEKK